MYEVVEYIIKFLLNGNDNLASHVGYTCEQSQFELYDVVIVPSHFFDEGVYGTAQSLPQLPLPEINGTPIIYGSNQTEQIGKTLVVHADLVASTFFLISRYEEWLNPNDCRDEHGRFIGKKSLPYRANFIDKPIIENYAKCLRSWLRRAGNEVVEPKNEFSAIYLTHDVDTLTQYRRVRSFCGGLLRNFMCLSALKRQLLALKNIENDPAFTFSWMLSQDNKVANAHQIYFVKSPVKMAHFDLPTYNLRGHDCRYLFHKLKANHCEIGLHASYYSGACPQQIVDEKKQLENALNCAVTANRWHYLRTLQPSDLQQLVDCNLTDDFTLGYADVAGFRLGTCRAVRWINPQTQELTSLVLHPLLAMDCTLSDERYMHLTEHAAENYVLGLLEQVKQNNGEAVLLWHNTVFDDKNYHKLLYPKLIDYLAQ